MNYRRVAQDDGRTEDRSDITARVAPPPRRIDYPTLLTADSVGHIMHIRTTVISIYKTKIVAQKTITDDVIVNNSNMDGMQHKRMQFQAYQHYGRPSR
jgi:hypothetical protein